uniref:Uncharacterized protein n=1 Tax=Triticum urartu TaxID=4572 RepID=A0A8R7TUI4_TRIUA
MSRIGQHRSRRCREDGRLNLLRRPLPSTTPRAPAPRGVRRRASAATLLDRSRRLRDGGSRCGGCCCSGVDVVLVRGVAPGAVALEGRAPDVARDVVDGALVRALEGEGGALRGDAGGADAVLLLEAAQLLDELVLGEVEGELAADLLVEGPRVVLVRREGGAPARRELEEPAQDEQLLLVRPQPLEQPPRVLRRTRPLRRRRRSCTGAGWVGEGGGWRRRGRAVGERWGRGLLGSGGGGVVGGVAVGALLVLVGGGGGAGAGGRGGGHGG